MQNFIHKIKFRKVNCVFQQELLEDIKNKIDCSQVIRPADKTSNFYETNPGAYNKLLHDNITSCYQREDNSTPMNISKEAKNIATNLKLADRINVTAEKHAYITLKDHKSNFETTPSCRLINPSKPELGKISKHILDNINSAIASRLSLNQWKNTQAVVNWFNNIMDKNNYSFIEFDIVNFYASITAKLLNAALNFASSYVNIS